MKMRRTEFLALHPFLRRELGARLHFQSIEQLRREIAVDLEDVASVPDARNRRAARIYRYFLQMSRDIEFIPAYGQTRPAN